MEMCTHVRTKLRQIREIETGVFAQKRAQKYHFCESKSNFYEQYRKVCATIFARLYNRVMNPSTYHMGEGGSTETLVRVAPCNLGTCTREA
jgi:hypothetical protein